jgi:hypothetical protein
MIKLAKVDAAPPFAQTRQEMAIAPPINRTSPMTLRPRYRSGRCYELAWKYLAYEARFEGWRLVHGEIISPIGDGQPMEHAWLEKEGNIYDPVFDKVFQAADYRTKYHAKATLVYSQTNAMRLGAERGHYGPWN